MVVLVVKYRCENWTIEKIEHWRIDTFELWCWRRLLRSPLDSKELKPVSPKEINPEYSLEELMLKLQYFGHLMWSGKDPDSGKDQRQEEKGTTEDEMAGWHPQFNGHEFEQTLVNSEG